MATDGNVSKKFGIPDEDARHEYTVYRNIKDWDIRLQGPKQGEVGI